MQRACPEPPGDKAAAAEGTAAHWVMAEVFAGRRPAIGAKTDNGVLVTDEMLDAVDVLVDDVMSVIGPHGMTLADCIVESPVDIKRIHDECWGTPDVRAWVGGVLYVWDFKFGYGFVNEFENEQLLAYAVGAIDQAGRHDLDVIVDARIVQPRCYSPEGAARSWRFRACDQRALVNIISNAVHEGLGPQPKTKAGEHCENCTARRACESNRQSTSHAMAFAQAAVPHELTPEALGVELYHARAMLNLLTARVEALDEQGMALARAGARIPGHRLESSAGRKVWTKPDSQVIAAGRLLDIDLAKPAEAITPTQALKLGFPEQALEAFVKTKSGAARLVRDDGSHMRKVFLRSA